MLSLMSFHHTGNQANGGGVDPFASSAAVNRFAWMAKVFLPRVQRCPLSTHSKRLAIVAVGIVTVGLIKNRHGLPLATLTYCARSAAILDNDGAKSPRS